MAFLGLGHAIVVVWRGENHVNIAVLLLQVTNFGKGLKVVKSLKVVFKTYNFVRILPTLKISLVEIWTDYTVADTGSALDVAI